MKKAASALLLIFFLTACAETADSVFRPDFGTQSSDAQSNGNYTPPPATARAQAARTATKSAPTEQESPRAVSPYTLPPGQPAGNPTPRGNPQQRHPTAHPAANPTPSGVDSHYEQQLKLQQGDTTPGPIPPPTPPKDRSWFGSIFGSDDPEPPTDAPSNCYRGKLTSEGVSCQAMRTNDGRLITLGGPLRGFGPGDAVCVCGPVAETSFCQQGTTIYVAQIDTRCDTP